MAVATEQFVAPPRLAIAANATTPDPGAAGVTIWSTITNSELTWNGTAWVAASTGSSGGGTSDAFTASFFGGL